MIPFLNLKPLYNQLADELDATFKRVMQSGWYIMGEELKRFEQLYAQYNNVSHCIGVANGLDALTIALKSLGIHEGDEVIVPSNTYIASLLAVSTVGAKPVLVEPRIETYNINPDLIESAITPRTRAIMPVHLYGQACEMETIQKIAQKHLLFIVEDNAQAQGAHYYSESDAQVRLTGAWGDISGTSFYPGKNLGAFGDAGAITTNTPELAQFAQTYRNYGSKLKYYNEIKGINSRLDELQAALIAIKLPYLDAWNNERQRLAALYTDNLAVCESVITPRIAKGATSVFHLYVIRMENPKHRSGLIEHLAHHQIGTLIHYPIPPHLQKAYMEKGANTLGYFPVAENIAQTCLSLPLYPGLTEAEVNYISETIINYFKK